MQRWERGQRWTWKGSWLWVWGSLVRAVEGASGRRSFKERFVNKAESSRRWDLRACLSQSESLEGLCGGGGRAADTGAAAQSLQEALYSEDGEAGADTGSHCLCPLTGRERQLYREDRWELARLIWQTLWLFCSLMISESYLLCSGISVTASSECCSNRCFSWKIGPMWALCVVYLSSIFIALLPCPHDARGLSFLKLCCENCFLKGTEWSLITGVVLSPEQCFSADSAHIFHHPWHQVSCFSDRLQFTENFQAVLKLT